MVARSNKRYREIYRWVWYVLEDEESDKGTGRKSKVEQNTSKTIDSSNSQLYNQVTISSRKGYNHGILQ